MIRGELGATGPIVLYSEVSRPAVRWAGAVFLTVVGTVLASFAVAEKGFDRFMLTLMATPLLVIAISMALYRFQILIDRDGDRVQMLSGFVPFLKREAGPMSALAETVLVETYIHGRSERPWQYSIEIRFTNPNRKRVSLYRTEFATQAQEFLTVFTERTGLPVRKERIERQPSD